MTKTIFIAILLLPFLSSNDLKAQAIRTDTVARYTVTGKLLNYDSGWVYIKHGDGFNKNQKTDSAKVVDGAFNFSGEISGIESFLLGVRGKDNKGKLTPSLYFRGPFILSPGNLYIEGDFNSRLPLNASGTKAQDEYNAFKKKLAPLSDKAGSVFRDIRATKKSNSKRIDSLNKQMSLVQIQLKEAVKAHVLQFPNSLVSAYIAKSESTSSDPNTVKLLYDGLTDAVKESLYGKALLYIFQSTEATALGRITPSFSIPDSKGELVSLEVAMGTYTLIDFWASWCSPCREENPYLVKAYDSYKAKGFKIIGVSMDTNKAAWLKAVNDDKLTWLQLSDLKGTQSETGKKYGITAIPTNFLIDKEGKIIARNLKGTQLINKLKEVL